MSDPSLVRKAAEGVRPETAGWKYLSFRTRRLAPGEELAGNTKAEETALIWLGGTAEVDGFGEVGERDHVFDGKPSALLLPPRADYRLRALTSLQLAIVSAPAESTIPPRVIRPNDVRVEVRGKGITERRIHWILSETDAAARLILVEVLTPAGHWSTFPPHKHDEDKPGIERALEELYYYQFNPEQGFAFQGIYTKPSPSPCGGGQGGGLNVSIRARNEDLVLVPRGYHVVSAAPGYDCYYLNAMAGDVREWLFTTDPDHEWLMDWKKT
ncbi:MAG TPA: 5-deoxy-glucuronate isomerase [Candidatus Dormibacteraeota bacterium]|nr:5-deoxy-glucuronate isomerase [Candidatus Dormibacteraeota bacterium]